jgi:hypothetical protein
MKTFLLVLLLIYVLGVIVVRAVMNHINLKKLLYNAYSDVYDLDKLAKEAITVIPLIWPLLIPYMLFTKISDEEREIIDECLDNDD